MLLAVGVTLKVPDVFWLPDHAPDAVHDVADVDDHVRVLLLPDTIEFGLAVIVTVGTGWLTLTTTDWLELPSALVHVIV